MSRQDWSEYLLTRDKWQATRVALERDHLGIRWTGGNSLSSWDPWTDGGMNKRSSVCLLMLNDKEMTWFGVESQSVKTFELTEDAKGYVNIADLLKLNAVKDIEF